MRSEPSDHYRSLWVYVHLRDSRVRIAACESNDIEHETFYVVASISARASRPRACRGFYPGVPSSVRWVARRVDSERSRTGGAGFQLIHLARRSFRTRPLDPGGSWRYAQDPMPRGQALASGACGSASSRTSG